MLGQQKVSKSGICLFRADGLLEFLLNGAGAFVRLCLERWRLMCGCRLILSNSAFKYLFLVSPLWYVLAILFVLFPR